MDTDKLTLCVMGHIRANNLDGDYISGKIVWERVIEKWNNLPLYKRDAIQAHKIIDPIVKEVARMKHYKDDFEDLLK